MGINIRYLSNKIGIDSAIIYTILARMIQAGGGVISIIFIAKYLSKEEQGFYFTFGSILAIQIFFELGLSGIITQFVAHETAHIDWVGKAKLVGSDRSISRLSSLLRFCLKWFVVVAIFLMLLLIVTGFLFFYKYGKGSSQVNWQNPWIILSISTAFSLMVSPVLAFFEGLGKVNEIAKIRLIQQSVQLLMLFVFLTKGFKLYSSPLASVCTFMIAPLWIIFSYRINLLFFIWNQLGKWKVNYKFEIFPYQWRIALSWISGYFIFQLFNPVLFANDGPIVAGQMGMTLAVLNGVLSISLSWINTKVPLFSILISKREFIRLDEIFKKTVKQASLICAICLLILLIVVFIMQFKDMSVGQRFVPIVPLVLLSLVTFINQLVSALATYLRCHKQEPLLTVSLLTGIFTATSTFILGNLFGMEGMVIGYFCINIFLGLPWVFYIFKTKKLEWHS